jgi:hypothetical protein
MNASKKFTLQMAEVGVLATTMIGAGITAAHADSLDDNSLANITTKVSPDHGQNDLGNAFKLVSNTLIVIVVVVSVIMLIIGGLRYVLSSGNASAVEGAKNTILYAVIGIIVALLAAAIVNFVVGKFA